MSDSPLANNSVRVTSLSLLERLAHQDEDAWRRFVHLYGPLLHQWLRPYHLQDDDLADLCQDVFRNLVRSLGTYHRPTDRPGSFRAWLRTVAHNCVREFYRRQIRQPTAVGGSEAYDNLQQVPDLADGGDGIPDDERVGLVTRALELLQPHFNATTWQAFRLVTFEGRSPNEVADQLNLTPFAVRQACYRVRNRLREELAGLIEVA
jgi:RNA polymerase sigma-70 factor (ECF subfamily)